MPLLNNRRAIAVVVTVLAVVPVVAQDRLPPPEVPGYEDLPGNGPRGTSQAGPGDFRYDEVGYAGIGGDERAGIAGAHRSLPGGSFVEVTSLDSGKTILVITTGRSTSGRLIDLTPSAARLLGLDGGRPVGVRVRRVNPPGGDQQALRDGRAASDRIDSPPVLLTALRKRLPGGGARAVSMVMQPELSMGGPAVVSAPRRPIVAERGSIFVQVAAFSTSARARAVADELGGSVQPVGRFFRVRTGPFSDAASAQRARDAVVRRGYADAHIVKDN